MALVTQCRKILTRQRLFSKNVSTIKFVDIKIYFKCNAIIQNLTKVFFISK